MQKLNVFEFLGLPAYHRKPKKIYQMVKHFDDVNPHADLGELHKKVSFPMFGQVKRDGVFVAVVVNNYDELALYNRTGKLDTSTECIIATLSELNLRPGVYLGELLSRHPCSLEQLSGVVTPTRKKPLKTDSDGCNQVAISACLYIDFFDHITLGEFERGYSERPYSERHAHVSTMRMFAENILTILPYVTINSYEELLAFADKQIADGQEGAVFKQDVGYVCGAKDWHQMKIVRGYHVDLLCIGFEQGTGKYKGLVANLYFKYKDGKELKAMPGRGWTHAACQRLYDSGMANNEYSPIGKIYHVAGLQPSSKNGLIRLPKVREERFDKAEPDF